MDHQITEIVVLPLAILGAFIALEGGMLAGIYFIFIYNRDGWQCYFLIKFVEVKGIDFILFLENWNFI